MPITMVPIHHILTVLPLAMSPLTAASSIPPTTQCKATPSSSAWPSHAQWSTLNQTLGGSLMTPRPPAAVCHHDQPEYDPKKCAVVQQEWSMYDFHAANPISVMWDNWANDTCLPVSNVTCSAKGYPSYVVNARCATEVRTAVLFAAKHNIRLNVKASGHDFYGRSNAPFSLSIWTRNLNSLEYYPSSYTLASGRKLTGDYVKVGGGADMGALYNLTAEHGHTIVGGGARSVSVGGYLGGGGHGLLGPKFGMAADNVVEAEIVTADGKILTVNEDEHCDLFFALRGSGGSTLGVMTSVTIKTHPSPQITSSLFYVLLDMKDPELYDILAFIWSQYPGMMDKGMTGYTFASDGAEGVVPGIDGPLAGVAGSVSLPGTKDTKAIEKILQSMFDAVSKKYPGRTQSGVASTTAYDSFIDWYDVNFDNGTAGGDAVLVSRLLDRKTLTGNQKKLASAIKFGLAPMKVLSAYMLGLGSKASDSVRNIGLNGVNPAWRTAILHTIGTVPFPPLNATAAKEAAEFAISSYQGFRDITPNGGAYINEGNGNEPNPGETFWGTNYAKLLATKRKYDPKDVFWCTPCVGNEHWKETKDGRLCKV